MTDDDLNSFPEARQVLSKIQAIFSSQVETLQDHVARNFSDEVGSKASQILKEAVTTVTGQVTGLYNMIRTEKVSKMLRDDYTALCLSSLTYGMLYATARGLGDDTTAELAKRQMKVIPPLIMELNHVIPAVVVRELLERGVSVDSGAEEETILVTKDAWRSAEANGRFA